MKYITEKEMGDLINKYNNGEEIPKGRFMCMGNESWTNMDNIDGMCYVEDFYTKEECFMRCIGYLDTEGNPYNVQELCRDFLELVNHIVQFEGNEAANVFESMNMPRELADY